MRLVWCYGNKQFIENMIYNKTPRKNGLDFHKLTQMWKSKILILNVILGRQILADKCFDEQNTISSKTKALPLNKHYSIADIRNNNKSKSIKLCHHEKIVYQITIAVNLWYGAWSWILKIPCFVLIHSLKKKINDLL